MAGWSGARAPSPSKGRGSTSRRCLKRWIRPEHVRFDERSGLRGAVYGSEYLGTTQVVAVETADGLVKARVPADVKLSIGEPVGLALNPTRLSLFHRASGRAIRTANREEALNG